MAYKSYYLSGKNPVGFTPQPQSVAPRPSLGSRFFNTTPGRAVSGVLKFLDWGSRKLKQGIATPFLGRDVARQIGQKDVSGYLESTGRLRKATDFKGKFRNIAIDVLTDPTTFLTFGVGAGAKIAGKAGVKTLNKAGTKEFVRLVGNASKGAARGTAREVSEEVARKTLAARFARSPQLAAKLTDQGGVKFFGKTVVPGKVSTEPLGKMFSKVTSPLKPIFGGREYLLKDKHPDLINIASKSFTEPAGRTARVLAAADDVYKKAGITGKKGDRAAEQITEAIVTGKVNLLPKELQKVANFVNQTMESYGKELGGEGLLKELREHYLTILVKGMDKKQASRLLGNLPNPKKKAFAYAIPRQFEDILDAEAKLGKGKVEKDVRKILAVYVDTADRAIARRKMITKFGSEVGVPEMVTGTKFTSPDDYLKTDPLVDDALEQIPNPDIPMGYRAVEGVPELKGKLIPDDVARYLDQHLEVVRQDADISKIIENYDKVISWYKKSVTAHWPAFHFRNFLGNNFQNYIDMGLIKAVNPKYHAKAIRIMRGGKAAADEVVKVGNQTYKVKDIRRIMQDEGVVKSGWGFIDLNVPYNKRIPGYKVGEAIENEARAVNFLVNLEKSGDIATAAQRTNKFLFDYQNLTPFERKYLRRLHYFYTWPSRNIALQMQQLAKDPGKFTKFGIIQGELSSDLTEQEQALLPDYTRADLHAPIGKDEFGRVKSATGIDFPLGGALEALADPFKYAIGALNPIIKAPFEIASGRDFRTGQELKEASGAGGYNFLRMAPDSVKKLFGFSEQTKVDQTTGKEYQSYTANPYMLYALKSLSPTSRLTSEAARLTDESKPLSERFIRFMSGLRIDQADLNKQIGFQSYEYAKELASDYMNKGLIKKGDYGYYVPKDLVLGNERVQLENIAETLNDSGSRKELFLESIGAKPDMFPEAFASERGENTKKFTNRQQAALLAFYAGMPDVANQILLPNTFRTRSSGSRRAIRFSRPPSTKLSRRSSGVRLKKASVGTFRAL